MFKKSFKRTLAILTTMLIAFVAVTPINASAAWAKDSKGNYYYKDDSGKFLTGFQTIGDNTYYFGKDGKMYTSKWVTTTSGSKYYFKKDGTMTTGKIKLNGKVYEFDSSGKLISFDIWAPLKGLEWGMSDEEVIKTLDLKEGDYTYPEDFAGDVNAMIVLDKSDKNSYTIYMFDKTLGLTNFSHSLSYSAASLSCIKNGFTNEGFELLLDEDNDGIYSAMYVGDNLIGIVTSFEDTISYSFFPIKI